VDKKKPKMVMCRVLGKVMEITLVFDNPNVTYVALAKGRPIAIINSTHLITSSHCTI